MSKNKISKKLKIGSLAGGLAFGGLSFCGLNDVDADIVPWANTGGAVNPGAVGSFDVDGGGVNDLVADNGGNASFGFQALSVRNGGRLRGAGYVVPGASYGTQLRAFNTSVQTYVVSANNPGRAFYGYVSINDEAVGSQWAGNPLTRNFAFEFENDTTGQVNFGWGTLQYNGQDQTFTITEGYYENMGNSIIVGQTASVPEPSSLMLLGLGAAGLAGFRRKRSA